jgi:hypothetical protein
VIQIPRLHTDSATALQRLIGRRVHVDGGVSTQAHAHADLESTAWAILAEAADAPGANGWIRAQLDVGGNWTERRGPAWVVWQTGVVLAITPSLPREAARAGCHWLLSHRGRRLPLRLRLSRRIDRWRARGGAVEMNDELVGWSWADGTSAWVEPTAMAALALARHAPIDIAFQRGVRDAVALLIDRQAPDGGWNYGNVRVLDYDLDSFLDTTGWAVIGLSAGWEGADIAERRRLVDVARRGLGALATMSRSDRSAPLGLAVAWHACMIWGAADDAARVAERLRSLLPAAIDATNDGYPILDTRTAALALLVIHGRPLREPVQ